MSRTTKSVSTALWLNYGLVGEKEPSSGCRSRTSKNPTASQTLPTTSLRVLNNKYMGDYPLIAP